MLLNLGTHFKLPRNQWKDLTDRIGLKVKGQEIAVPYSKEVEGLAERYSKQLLIKQAHIVNESSKKQEEFHEVDVLSLKHDDVRTIGAEHVLLNMIQELGPLTYGENEDEVFLGRSITRHQQMSEETAKKVDAEIKKIVDTGYKKAKKNISRKNR